jgi:flagellar FliL protein
VAEEDKKEEQGEEGEKKSKKGLIIIIVGVLVAIGASVGVTLFLLGGNGSSEGEEGATEEIEEVKVPSIYYEVKPAMLTTFSVGGRQRYMQIHLSVSSREQASIDAVEHHLPLLKSRLNSLFSQQKFDEVQTDAGKLALRESTLNLINEVLEAEGETPIESVFFTNFVLQ